MRSLWVIILLGWGSSAVAENDGYTLDTAPWSNQEFEVCPVPNDNGLRAVIFKPEIEEWSYVETGPLSVRLEFSERGVTEVVIKDERILPAYYLKEQRIGYLDDRNNWVSKSGILVTSVDQLESISGEKAPPTSEGSYEKYVYKANFKLEYAAAIEKLHYEPPCTMFSVGHFDKFESETYHDFGKNNPYECGSSAGLKRSQDVNYTEKSYRPVICCPDGSNYYVKFPEGEIKTYRAYHDMQEVLYPKDKTPICNWNNLGSLIGYDLIRSDG